MILAYVMSAHDGDVFFFEDRRSAIFCPICGSLLDKSFVPRAVRPRKKWDICSSYDNRKIVTQRFREWCREQGLRGLTFRQVNTEPPYYVLEPSSVLRFDTRRARTRFENKCARCGNYESVVGTDPPGLLDIHAPIEHGIFRTDIEFGSRWEKSPLLIIGHHTMGLIKNERFRLVGFYPITD